MAGRSSKMVVCDLPPKGLPLGDNDIHVWYAPTGVWVDHVSNLAALLSPDEQARARRFLFERDRVGFTLARGILRSLLAAYCNTATRDLAFEYTDRGKPALAPHAGGPQFNLSHTRGMAVYAFTRSRRVGVDVELIRHVSEADRIVEQRFAPEEVVVYQALPAAERARGFFNCWTRKEAFVKALGHGLGYPLDAFAVSLAPGEAARFLRVAPDCTGAEPWNLYDLAIDPPYVAALAVEGRGLHVECRELRPAGPRAAPVVPEE